jgi:hypothetical protein
MKTEKNNQNPMIPEAKSMTRRQWLDFKASGKDPAYMEISDSKMLLKVQADAYDWIITHIYAAEQLGDVPMNELNALAEKTYYMTYGRPETEKN